MNTKTQIPDTKYPVPDTRYPAPNTEPPIPGILLVDDDPSILKIIATFLESLGYHVTTAESGEDAIELLNRSTFDVVITDLIMGDVDGYQVLKTGKNLRSETMFVVLTAHSDATLIVNALRLGADDYLIKPCEPEEIRFHVERCLEKLEIRKKVKEAEENLRDSEDRFRTLFEKVPTPVQGYGPDGTIHYWNRACEKSYGYKNEEAIGKNLTELIIPPEMRDFVREVIKTGSETGEMPPSEELLLMRKDGSRVPVFSSHVVLKRKGKAPELFCLDVDLTEQKRLQDRLQQAQKIEAIATLAGGIAHQFNNALSGITGNIDLFKLDYPDDNNIKRYLAQMSESARRMAGLTDQLLAYAGGGKYQARALDLNDMVKKTLPGISHRIDSAIRVETALAIGISSSKADFTQMQTLLSAIVTNAAEAIEGTGLIRITTRDREIDDRFSKEAFHIKPGHYVCLTVEDDGRGMDTKTKARIFEPFFTTNFEGRGLGMAAVYGIVKNHDGYIHVDSEPGIGTMVRIYLPALEVPEEEVKEIRAEPVKGTGTILLIEDEAMVMDVTRAILERLGYTVIEAKTGREALEIAGNPGTEIDLALLDIILPDIGGKEIYQRLMEAKPDLKVLVYSGYSIEGPARETLDAGAEGFIQKPFTMAAISEKLKEILEGPV